MAEATLVAVLMVELAEAVQEVLKALQVVLAVALQEILVVMVHKVMVIEEVTQVQILVVAEAVVDMAMEMAVMAEAVSL